MKNLIYNKAFSNYISPSLYEKMCDKGWFFEPFPRSVIEPKKVTLRMIDEYLSKGIKVKCGYMCTSVRGFHIYYVISKQND